MWLARRADYWKRFYSLHWDRKNVMMLGPFIKSLKPKRWLTKCLLILGPVVLEFRTNPDRGSGVVSENPEILAQKIPFISTLRQWIWVGFICNLKSSWKSGRPGEGGRWFWKFGHTRTGEVWKSAILANVLSRWPLIEYFWHSPPIVRS